MSICRFSVAKLFRGCDPPPAITTDPVTPNISRQLHRPNDAHVVASAPAAHKADIRILLAIDLRFITHARLPLGDCFATAFGSVRIREFPQSSRIRQSELSYPCLSRSAYADFS